MARAKDEADFVGPLQLLVVGTLGYLAWTAWRKATGQNTAALPTGQGGTG